MLKALLVKRREVERVVWSSVYSEQWFCWFYNVMLSPLQMWLVKLQAVFLRDTLARRKSLACTHNCISAHVTAAKKAVLEFAGIQKGVGSTDSWEH